jgi:nitrogen regulatory protein PII
MKHIDNLDLDDPKVKEWMNIHFKAGEYMLLSVAVQGKGADADRLVEHLKAANLDIVIIPSLIIQIMVNLKVVNKLVEHLNTGGFKTGALPNVKAMLDFVDDTKKGTAN